MPSPEQPLGGRCACGAVRFELTEPFLGAGYCHCERCRRRSGVPFTLNALIAAEAFELTAGADLVETWVPGDGGRPKSFCGRCGGHVFGGDRGVGGTVVIRLGAVEGDPGIEPSWHAWVSSAPDWYPIPEDGLERFAGNRPAP